MKTIALFSKPNSPQAWGVLNEVVSWARQKGLQTLVGPGAAGGWTGSNWDEAYCSDVRAQADMALAIGGDGTLLGVARSLFGWDKPLLGVNLGHLGFLTDIAAKDIEAMLDALVSGAYTIENRILLEASKAEQTAPALAFNDVVFKGGEGSLAEFNVFVDGQSVYQLRADGLIISTPTGSTAYSLSANGPILHPALAAVALVPLCPHSLTARPITLPSSARIEVTIGDGSPCRVYCDGQPFNGVLTEGDKVVVSQGSTHVKMLHLTNYNLFKTLQQKLNWAVPSER
jgi:NAD+ kinase